jgi:hypothetical protein
MNEKIILYSDGRLTEEEKAAFENELGKSPQLREELKYYNSIIGNLKELKHITTDEGYFVQMIPKFRGRLNLKNRTKYIPRLAFSVTTLTAVIVAAFFLLNKNIRNDIPSSTRNNMLITFTGPNYSGVANELNSYADQYDISNMSSDEITTSDSLLSTMLAHELNLTPQSMTYFSAENNNVDMKNMLQGVNQKEADEIYYEILHKKIF